MKSALIALLVKKGWRLGYPVAVIVEQEIEGKKLVTDSFIAYITDAESSFIKFKTCSRGKKKLLELLDNKELFGYDNSKREWEIRFSDNSKQVRLFLGQTSSFARKAISYQQMLQYGNEKTAVFN